MSNKKLLLLIVISQFFEVRSLQGSNFNLIFNVKKIYLRFENNGKKVSLEWRSVKQILLRKRRKAGFCRPKTLEELAGYLLKNSKLKLIFKGVVKHGTQMALLFSTDKLISELNRQTEVYMDGTFEVMLCF